MLYFILRNVRGMKFQGRVNQLFSSIRQLYIKINNANLNLNILVQLHATLKTSIAYQNQKH